MGPASSRREWRVYKRRACALWPVLCGLVKQRGRPCKSAPLPPVWHPWQISPACLACSLASSQRPYFSVSAPRSFLAAPTARWFYPPEPARARRERMIHEAIERLIVKNRAWDIWICRPRPRPASLSDVDVRERERRGGRGSFRIDSLLTRVTLLHGD